MRTRDGYTLIELVVAIASASVLMVGLSSALFVSARALEMDNGATLQQSRAEQALARLMTELGDATRFEGAGVNALAFYVPDRDGDGLEERLAFSWSGVAGDPLMFEQNGRSVVLLNDVASLDFQTVTQSLTAQDVTIATPSPWPIVESSSFAEIDPKASSLVLPAPSGTVEGDLLIATVAIHNDRVDSLTPPSGWTTLDVGLGEDKVTLGVWWKLATDAEPSDYTWNWSGDEEAIGVGLRISNQYEGNPITAFLAGNGKSSTPECPSVAASLENSLVLRVGGFHKEKFDTPGDTGLIGHTDLHMDGVSDDVSLGIGYRVQLVTGDSGVANFVLNGDEEYRTMSLIIAPEGD